MRSNDLPPEDLEEGSTDHPGIFRIVRLAQPEWCWLGVGFIFLFLSLVPFLLMPLIFGRVVDDIVAPNRTQGERMAKVNGDMFFLFSVLLVGTLATVVRAFIFNAGGERVVARLRLQLFRGIIQQEIAMFDRRKTGELLSRLTSDTTQLQDVATTNVSMFVRAIAQIVFSAALMFHTSWRLAALVFSVVPICVISIACYGRVLKRLATRYSDALGVASDVAQQSVSNIRTVRSFAAEEIEAKKYADSVGDPDNPDNVRLCWYPRRMSSYKAGVQKQIANAFFMAFVTFVGSGAIVLVIWYGAREVIYGGLSQGDLVTFILYSVQIAGTIGMLSGLIASLFTAVGASKRTFQLIDRVPRVPVVGGHVPGIALDGAISFEDVTFSYPTRPDVLVLDRFSVNIPRDATVAFVGTSGAGKSTVLLLIQRFYDVTSGRILIDGIPLTTLDPSWLRRHFAYVQQEPTLFSGSIRQNIAYGFAVRSGSPDALPTDDDMEKAARAAFAHDFICAFPGGYDTMVGERGVRLSGGQKQRVAIARALLMDPRVLLLDEATSALDAESEAIVAQAIEKAMLGRTTLIVAHRLSTVKNAERIVVVEHGSIVDSGAHAELLGRCAKYKDLVQRQLQQGVDVGGAN